MYNVTYVWNFTVIALLVLYINYQNEEITTDTLTGLYNRRQAFRVFRPLCARAGEGQSSIALIMMDINNFKSINDRFGHSMGDEAIVTVARCLEAEFGWDDFHLPVRRRRICGHYQARRGSPPQGRAPARERQPGRQPQGRKATRSNLSLSAGYALYSKENDTMDAAV